MKDDTDLFRRALLAAILFAAACSPQPAPAPEPPPAAPPAADLPAGTYRIDRAHTTVLFRVNHIGVAFYTAGFADADATLELDPANPASARVEARVPVASLWLPTPPAGFRDELLGPNWFDAAQHPDMVFRSTRVELTSPTEARITGDLTLRGVTRPIALDATFHGGYAGHPLDPNARIGFSARGTFKRSEFGMEIGVPPPGSTMGVGDDVEVIIETEFTGPPWAGAAPP